MANPLLSFSFQVEPAEAGERLDSLVAARVEQCSRSHAVTLIRKGLILVDGAIRKASYTVKFGETVAGKIPPPEASTYLPESIPLDILYEDEDLLIVNKPPGMVVHPAPGHGAGTLVNALLHHCPDLAGISGSLRPGIVHRLDKDTSGALVVAKNSHAMQHLANQFKSRQVRKCYLALVYGIPKSDQGTVDLAIGRHPLERKRMSVHSRTPRCAVTHWRVKACYSGACLLELEIQTGRTHQIRVHCQAMGHPVIGDPVYGNRGSKRQLVQAAPVVAAAVGKVQRQMLHAWRLEIHHPVDDRLFGVEAPLPEDMSFLIAHLRRLSV